MIPVYYLCQLFNYKSLRNGLLSVVKYYEYNINVDAEAINIFNHIKYNLVYFFESL